MLTLEAWRRNWRRWLRREEPGHALAAAASSHSTISMVARVGDGSDKPLSFRFFFFSVSFCSFPPLFFLLLPLPLLFFRRK